MTPADLQYWQARMGLSQRGAAESLGVTLATYQGWLRGIGYDTGKRRDIDKRTALACAALEAGLPALGSD